MQQTTDLLNESHDLSRPNVAHRLVPLSLNYSEWGMTPSNYYIAQPQPDAKQNGAIPEP